MRSGGYEPAFGIGTRARNRPQHARPTPPRFAAQVYDLVITDWRLPDGDGRVVADWATALGGKAKVTSGYLSYMPGGVALGHETLMKPVRLSDLVAAVEGLIDKVLVA